MDLTFRYFFLGIYFVFSTLGVLQYLFTKKSTFLHFFFLCFVLFLRQLLQIINTETTIFNNKNFILVLIKFLGYLQPILFYLLIIIFFKLKRNQFITKFLVFGIIGWFAFCVAEIMGFLSVFIIGYYELLILATLLHYIYKNKTDENKYAFYGVIALIISAIEITINEHLVYAGIPAIPRFVTYGITHFSIIFDFLFFYLNILSNEKNTYQAKLFLENDNKTLKNEIEKIKKLVEDEHIILRDKTQINLKKLSHIKADDHYLNLHTIESKNYMVRGKLAEIMEELPSNFVRCHRSYIVNKNYIKQVQAKFIVLTDNSQVPISRGFKLLG
jgi:hypothetical protein